MILTALITGFIAGALFTHYLYQRTKQLVIPPQHQERDDLNFAKLEPKQKREILARLLASSKQFN